MSPMRELPEEAWILYKTCHWVARVFIDGVIILVIDECILMVYYCGLDLSVYEIVCWYDCGGIPGVGMETTGTVVPQCKSRIWLYVPNIGPSSTGTVDRECEMDRKHISSYTCLIVWFHEYTWLAWDLGVCVPELVSLYSTCLIFNSLWTYLRVAWLLITGT